ncbi:MAG: hypothetical protein WKF78_14930 [Candidatus Limnocylindrales bacterium]
MTGDRESVALDPAIAIEPIRSVRIPYSRRRYLLTNTHPGSVAVARVSIPQVSPITIVSVYGVWDGPVVSNMLRVIADLVPLFDSPDGAASSWGRLQRLDGDHRPPSAGARARRSSRPFDRSVSSPRRTWPTTSRCRSPTARAGWAARAVTSRPGAGRTWTTSSSPPALASQVVGLNVDPTVIAAGLSDHAPLILDLDLSPDATPHGWDEKPSRRRSVAATAPRRDGSSTGW